MRDAKFALFNFKPERVPKSASHIRLQYYVAVIFMAIWFF